MAVNWKTFLQSMGWDRHRYSCWVCPGSMALTAIVKVPSNVGEVIELDGILRANIGRKTLLDTARTVISEQVKISHPVGGRPCRPDVV